MSLLTPDIEATASNGGLTVVSTGSGGVTIAATPAAISSLLNPLLIKIVSTHTPYDEIADVEMDYLGVDEKIEHNNVSVYSEVIIDNVGYMELIESLILTIDDEEPGAQKRFLYAINQKYKVARRELFMRQSVRPVTAEQKLNVIRMGSDELILRVSELIVDIKTGFHGVPSELIEWARQLIVCYGFIHCKILEPPQ
ncbi:hypothetical protein J1G33_22125 [Pseudomonas sp. P867]|jgi:hypothetical protein|uniref:Uncharacterized protein n=1 Tax=Pseudomonas veronii TaxID=76761 RepID=A0ABS0VPK0_PSEVE|nr:MULTISPECIES: hypothetical protein [Pseudomonas]MBI6557234.1 hypothetical protein [Pseudomonas veronii]MBI6653467.1 hypothetical protein [Pseudomonas veronii]MBY8973092.1 hypothetical protein [Pseudomonas sp. P867]MCO7624848.1 hypothetical protein [Pseudomonas fluorescens]